MKKILLLALLLFTALTVSAQQQHNGSFSVNASSRFQRPRRQPNLGINYAKTQLEQLQSQLLGVEKEARAEIEGMCGGQLNLEPKGEFETTKEYEARKAKAIDLRPQIEEEVKRKTQALKDELNRRMGEILIMDFTLPLEAVLGVYDADTEIFPLVVKSYSVQESLPVPRPEAKELKENFSQAEKTGIFAIHLDAENHAKEYLLAVTISYRGKSYRTTSKEMNTERAMLMLYANYSLTSHRAKWKSEAAWYESDAEYRALEAMPILSAGFSESNINKFIVVTGSVSEGQEGFGACHTCGVRIGMAIFSQRDDIWRIEAAQKDLRAFGKWGIPPEGTLVKLGPDRYGVKLFWGDMGEGTEVEELSFIDRIDVIFKELLTIRVSENKTVVSTPGDRVLYNSKIEYLRGEHPIYFDLRVTVSGRRGARVGRKIVMRPFVDVKIYRFANEAYELANPVEN